MDRLVSIPREALAALLKASGSPLTLEAYLNSLREFDGYEKYASRQTAATWSKYFIQIAAIVSGLAICIPANFGFEGVLVTVILAGITFFEFRVYRAFRDRKPEAPTLGFRNQSAFATFILIYCLYHAFAPMQIQVPGELREYMDPDIGPLIRTVTIATYLIIGVVGGISQFGLAWYYWAARVKEKA